MKLPHVKRNTISGQILLAMDEPIYSQDIVKKTGLPREYVSSNLVSLEKKGLVEKMAGGKFYFYVRTELGNQIANGGFADKQPKAEKDWSVSLSKKASGLWKPTQRQAA